jgi:hypothetical protein
METKYLMVTNWSNHWDNLPNNRTYYTIGMLKGELLNATDKLSEENETLFIRKNKDSKIFEKAWIGKIKNIGIEDNRKIYFDVLIKSEINNCPDNLKAFNEGWYLKNWNINDSNGEFVSDSKAKCEKKSELQPPFFENLKFGNYAVFENDTYKFLKILGIHDIFKYDVQKGIADGFFKLNKLAVIYDNTLDDNFEVIKKDQIENFCSQISKNSISYKRKTINISGCKKQIWIITRKKSRLIEKKDDIEIKEISIFDLIEIYEERIIGNFDIDELENELSKIK